VPAPGLQLMAVPASLITTLSFCLLTIVVLAAIVIGLRRAQASWAVLLLLAFLYLLLPAILAVAGVLDRYNPLPAPALLLILGLTILTINLVRSQLGAHTAAAVPVSLVILFQSFRLVVEALLHRLYREGIVPVQMTYQGRNWDILSGLTGLLLGLWLVSGRKVPRSIVLAWNVLGLALLVNIVAIAVLSTPVPFRQFPDPPPNLLPSTFPFVWLPSFLVQVALGSHLLIFRQLKSTSQ